MPLPHRRVLIDTDTASDDAVALIMALGSPLIEVVAITTVAGNVPVAQATQNAYYTAELCRANVPIYQGAAKPLLRPLESATWFHGEDGLGDHGYAPQTSSPSEGHAVDAIIAAARSNKELEIITLGPLTNLALALSRAPEILANISRCVIMGGAPCCEGNVTPAAEFNIWVDPEAASIVFNSGLRTEMIGWQLSRGEAVLNARDIEQIVALQTPQAAFAIHCNSHGAAAYFTQTGEQGISLPDPIAMAILLDPALSVTTSDHYVAIETASALTRGMTIVDKLNVTADARNAASWSAVRATAAKSSICWELNVPDWKAALINALA